MSGQKQPVPAAFRPLSRPQLCLTHLSLSQNAPDMNDIDFLSSTRTALKLSLAFDGRVSMGDATSGVHSLMCVRQFDDQSIHATLCLFE